MRCTRRILTNGYARFLVTATGSLLASITAVLTLLLLLQGRPLRAQSGVLFVDAGAQGANDGISWSDAYTSLQDALDHATGNNGVEIWVAAGVYYPDEGENRISDDRGATFQLLDGVEIYGGFAGGESERDERDWQSNVTVLSGDLEQDDDVNANQVVTDTTGIRGSNAYHVVTGSGTGDSALLDGFTITAGLADGGFPEDSGAGMINMPGSPTLANLTFMGNKAANGAGLYNRDAASEPALTDLSFIRNRATADGGGLYNSVGASPTLSGARFIENAALGYGGGLFNEVNSSLKILDAVFEDNGAMFGGGLSDYAGELTIANAAFSGNSAGNRAGGLAVFESNLNLTNAVFRANEAGDDVGGLFGLESNISVTNAVFIANRANGAEGYGGAIGSLRGTITVTNASLVANFAGKGGGGAVAQETTQTIQNSIFWNNVDDSGTGTAGATVKLLDEESISTISHSLIQGSGGSAGWDGSLGTDGGGNIDADPRFLRNPDPEQNDYGDLRLQIASPALDAADDGSVPADVADMDGDDDASEPTPFDLNGQARFVDGNGDGLETVDMGAYEFGLDCASVNDVLFVNGNATGGSGDGSSWGNALTYLQDALLVADICEDAEEIWVSQGVYYPDEGAGQLDDDSEASFQLLDGVAIYGGFAGNESARDERDWQSNVTVLSGDVEQDDDVNANQVVTETTGIKGDNAYHVVAGSGVTTNAVLDGFTITAGHAEAAGHLRGGGMINDNGSPTVANVRFSGNYAVFGGGMANVNGSPIVTGVAFSGNSANQTGGGLDNTSGSQPALTDVTFSNNDSTGAGGGMANETSSPTLTNVAFDDNHALGNGGGIYNVQESEPTVTGATFGGNSSGSAGGGIYSAGNSDITLTDVSFDQNSSGGSGGGLFNGSGTPTLTNVTFSDNDAVGNGGGIYNSTPGFTLVDATFEINEAGNDGGAIYNLGSLSLSQGRIADNRTADATASSTFGDGGSGGGVYNSGTLTMLEVEVDGNFSGDGNDPVGGNGGHGGGLYNGGSGTMVLILASITGNQSGTGGAHPVAGGDGGHGGGIFNAGQLNVFQSIIGENETGDGGAGQTEGGRAGHGGGIFSASELTIVASSVISNSTGMSAQDAAAEGNGGGIYLEHGFVNLVNSTVSGNDAEGYGGGVYQIPTAELRSYNATVSNNNADANDDGIGDGGGLFTGGAVFLYNSIFAGNGSSPTIAHADCSFDGGTLEAAFYNLIGDDTGCDGLFADDPGNNIEGNLVGMAPEITALGDYGGLTPTHTLLPASPARDAGDPDGCQDHDANVLVTDQRSYPRPESEEGRCDIGAVEYTFPLISAAVAPQSVTEDDGVALTLTFTRTHLHAAGELTVSFEAGGTATYSSDYTLSGASGFDGASGSFTFGDGEETGILLITPIVDHVVEPDETVIITLTAGADYELGAPHTATGTIVDDDAGLLVDPTAGLVTTEAGGADTFTVTLQSQPVETVTVNLYSDDPGEGTVSPATLTFDAGNWDTPQVVTVTGVDDDEDDGDRAYTIVTSVSSEDPDYDGITVPDVRVTNMDDEKEYWSYLSIFFGAPPE